MRGRARRGDEWGRERVDVELIIQPKVRVWRLRLRTSGRGVKRIDEGFRPNGNVVARSGGVSGFRERGASGGEGERS